MSTARSLNIADLIGSLRFYFSEGSPGKPGMIALRHMETDVTVKRFRAADFDGKKVDEIAQRIVQRAQADAAAWKGVQQTYHVEIFIGEGANAAEETYAFSIAGEQGAAAARQRKGGQLGGTIGSTDADVIAELTRQNANLLDALLRATNIVGDWSETRTAEDRVRITHLESERERVWTVMDSLREIDREGQRADKEAAADAERWREGLDLLTMIGPVVINRIVGYKLLPEKEGKMLSEFRSIFDDLRQDADVFEGVIKALQTKPGVQAKLVSMFDRFLTDEERTATTRALIAKTKELPAKAAAAAE